MPGHLDRRQFLAAASALGAALAWPLREARASTVAWREQRALYPQGVASGDPTHDSVILWTRRPVAGGHRAPRLTVEIAEDDAFRRVVSTTAVTPLAENDFTVRVLAAGLKPRTVYWYRFTSADGAGSRIGRTITAPADDDARPAQFAFVSCHDLNFGASNAWRRMLFEDARRAADDRIGFVLHLGDFYYELVWYPEDRKTYYARAVRDIVRYPHGEKHGTFHVPTDLGDYRAIFHAYLSDPDLQDARARWPFVCMWDNHEFSWQGWQSYENYGQGPFPAQTRKVAAAQAWFEFQPSRIAKHGHSTLNHFDVPKVTDTTATTFDDHGLSTEPNNLAAISAVTLYRALRFGKHIELILTDNRSFRSQPFGDSDEANAFNVEHMPIGFPLEALEILDAGKAYNNGNPPATIAFGNRTIPNWRKDFPPQSILGKTQKAWFFDCLKASPATWKLWGNSIGTLDGRMDFQHLPKDMPPWLGAGYAMLTVDDWAGYRTERGEIFDLVKNQGITGFASLCGDRHSFWAGLMSKSLPPEPFEPVGVEFITGSISAPGFYESLEYGMPKTQPLRPLFVHDVNGKARPAVNFATIHGVKATLALKEGDEAAARALSNPENAPHLSFMDWGGHGFVVMRATPDALEAEFVGIERPVETSPAPDGGPLAYRVRHRARLWQPGEAPKLEQTVVEGNPPLAT